MYLKLLVAAALMIAAASEWAQADSAVTNEDAQQVIEIISGDKEKTQAYCDMLKLGNQVERAEQGQNQESTDELDRQMDELAQKLGPEYVALMDEYKDIDPSSEAGQETGAIVQETIEALDKLCGSEARRPGRD